MMNQWQRHKPKSENKSKQYLVKKKHCNQYFAFNNYAGNANSHTSICSICSGWSLCIAQLLSYGLFTAPSRHAYKRRLHSKRFKHTHHVPANRIITNVTKEKLNNNIKKEGENVQWKIHMNCVSNPPSFAKNRIFFNNIDVLHCKHDKQKTKNKYPYNRCALCNILTHPCLCSVHASIFTVNNIPIYISSAS